VRLQLLRTGIFFGSLILIAFIQWFWFVNAWRWIGGMTAPGLRHTLQGVWVVALLVLLAAFLEPFSGHIIPREGFGSWLVGIARVWLVASVFAFIAFQAVNLVGWVSHTAQTRLAGGQTFDPARRNLFRYAAYLAGSLPFLAATYGVAAGRLNYRVEEVDVPIAGLPKTLDGLRIAQLSDFHIGEFMPREEIARAVGIANGLRPDLAVVTGDFVSGENDPLEECIAEIGKLRAPLGTWGCNGNHEIYAHAENAAQSLFQRYGMKLLRQENVELDWRGAKLNLIGVDYQRDFMTHGPHGKALEGVEHLVRRDIPNVLLSHNPNSFRRAADLGIELSLAGHTHGGQVKVEIVDHSINPARLITDFVAGLFHLPLGNGRAQAVAGANGSSGKSAYLYVNRGLGTFGFPVRLGVPPEITLLTLRTV
jgi:hypothetical protein